MTNQIAIGCERGNPLSPPHGTYDMLKYSCRDISFVKNNCCYCFVMLVYLLLWFILCVFCVCFFQKNVMGQLYI